MNVKYQVFVSSTHNDLIDERLAVIQCLLDNDCIPVGMKQFHGVPIGQWDYITRSAPPRVGRKKGLARHIGKSKGGNNTKIHAAVDKHCRPIKLFLSAGNVNDIKVAPLLLNGLSLDSVTVMADKAYCSRKFLSLIERKGGRAYIPCKKTYKIPWETDREQYKRRNVVERFFQRLKENHRLAMRYDKRADRFFSFVLFASTLLWLK